MSGAAPVRGLSIGAGAGLVASAALRRRPPGGAAHWVRTNYRGRPVSLLGGPALSVGALAGLLAGWDRRLAGAAAAAVLPAAVAGLYDDLGGSASVRGLAGHLGALRHGRVTTGAVKVVLLGAGGLAAAARLGAPARDAVPIAGVVAGTANLVNLLDLRPGRATKAVLWCGLPLLAGGGAPAVAGPLGAAAALLPADLAERTMLGDTGAGALGAALGVGLVAAGERRTRWVVLAAVTALTVASERVSFSAVIERSTPLRWLDRLGRTG